MVARKRDDIPEEFKSIEDAGTFWDTHSLAEFDDLTKKVEMDFVLSKRTRYITVPEKIYQRLVERAGRKKRTVRELLVEFVR